MNTFQLEIVTPTSVYDEGQITYLRCPGLDGLFGVMANHTKSIIALAVGELKITKEGKDYYYATSGGYAEIIGDKVQLLAETAENADEINIDRAKSSADRAKERLSEKSKIDFERAEISLKRAINRLRIAKR